MASSSSTPRRRRSTVARYVDWAQAQAVKPTDPKAFRRCLQPGDVATVLYRNGTRSVVVVTRLTTCYVWTVSAADFYTRRKNPNEWGYSLRTGLEFGGATERAGKPLLLPPTEEEKAKAATMQKENTQTDAKDA